MIEPAKGHSHGRLHAPVVPVITGLDNNPFAYPPTGRTRKLPRPSDRRSLTVHIAKALDLKLEVHSLLEERPKNDVVSEAVRWFLDGGYSCEIAHKWAVPNCQKRRATYIICTDLELALEEAVRTRECSKTCVVTAALVLYLIQNEIDPYSDPSPMLKQALRSPVNCDSF